MNSRDRPTIDGIHLFQVQKNQGIIDKVVSSIASAVTVKEPPAGVGETMDLQVPTLTTSALRRALATPQAFAYTGNCYP